MKRVKVNETMMLALVVGSTLIIMVGLRVFLPSVDLPVLNIPNIAGLSLISLLFTHYFGEKQGSNPMLNLIFAAIIFGCLPWFAALTNLKEALWMAGAGGLEYTLISWMFGSMTDRMEGTGKRKLTPVCSAFVLFLAFQAFTNILI